MTALHEHALADTRHQERYAAAAAASAGPTPRARRGSAAFGPARRRLGVLLVEAGLHLMTRSETAPQVSSRFV